MAGGDVKGARPVHAAPLSTSVLRPGIAANSPEAQNKGLAEGVLYSTTNLALYFTSTKGLSNSGNHSEADSQPPKYVEDEQPTRRAGGPAAGRRSHLRSKGEIEV
jgi:hypothetical protein